MLGKIKMKEFEERVLNKLRERLNNFGINKDSKIDFERLMIILEFYETEKWRGRKRK